MRILAIPNAHALAHVSRLLEIARELRELGHSVEFAGHGKYLEAASWDGFAIHELPYISVERVVHAVRTQKLWELYREDELARFIDAERALYAKTRAELVLIDNRPTARTSAELAGIPTVAVLNVHMSRYRRIPFFSYAQLFGSERMPGVQLLDRAEKWLEGRLYDRLVMGDLNRLRKRHGLPRLDAYEHEEGDVSLLADIPEFNPVDDLPANVHFVGPLTWHNQLPAPRCLDRLDPDRPTAYFTLGSEGLEDLLPDLGTLASEGIQIVVATGAAETSLEAPPGVYFERFVNANALLPHCDLVCCHGGNGTLYQALGFGLPLVVVATHAEQHFGGKRIRQLGLGKAITLRHLRRKGIRELIGMIRDVLGDASYRNAAQSFAEKLHGWDAPRRARDIILGQRGPDRAPAPPP
ncbi:MAG: hypothetical protein KDH15_05155 [Rhodocyclaceae bacterium]|nr:hypothetical protein [Rhodocyclaceae bacterium]